MSDKLYKFGDSVRSIAVGDRPAFVGVIAYVGHSYYHVRDEDGNYWHRSGHELKPSADGAQA
jgi:hypothetical protein